MLEEAGLNVEYRESDVGHTIDPGTIRPAGDWLEQLIP